ncbi:MAG: hypothetical protein R3D32_11640 [Nitratireductor sp.]
MGQAVVRTKTNRWAGPMPGALFALLERLRLREISRADYQRELLLMLEGENLGQSLAAEIGKAMASHDQLELLRCHVNECRYTALLYRVDDSEAHPPHEHFNMISTQVVIAGKIHLREYQRNGREDGEHVTLELVRDAVLGPGDVFNASEWERNVHWFSAEGGPALIFNINARGYEPSTFPNAHEPGFGRLYVDPTGYDEAGVVHGEELTPEEARQRFGWRRLSEFPVPESALERTCRERLSISLTTARQTAQVL